jgi:glycerol-3-phosphate dehydrogenase
MPITTEIYNILYKNKSIPEALSDLMQRKLKEEKC